MSFEIYSKHNTNVSVNFINVTLNGSDWKMYGLNALLNNSNLEKVKNISLIAQSKGPKKFINIFNSTLHYLYVKNRYIINISQCNFRPSDTIISSLLDVSNSDLTIVNSTIHRIRKFNSGAAVVNAINSTVKMKYTNCTENYAANGLFQTSKNSHMVVEESMFRKNGHVILSSSIIVLNDNSSLIVRNSRFIQNGALYGACFFASGRVTIQVTMSSFLNNVALKGGIIYYNEEENITTNSQIRSNQENNNTSKSLYLQSDLLGGFKIILTGCRVKSLNPQSMVEGGVVYAKGLSVRVFIIKCKFNINIAARGGVLYVSGKMMEKAKVFISKSSISSLAFLQGGSLFCERIATQVVNCSFHNEFSGQGSSIFASDRCHVNISSSIFNWTVGIAGCISIRKNVLLQKHNSSFIAFPFFSSIIAADDNCMVYAGQSIFTSGDLFPASALVFNLENSVKLVVFNSTFEAKLGINLRILYAENNVDIDFIKCLFYKVSGFMIYKNTTLNFTFSTIIGCINTLQSEAFIVISEQSHLKIYHSNITKNNILETNTFIYVGSKGSFVSYNSSFQKNNMSRHIVVEDGIRVILTNSTFQQNYVRGIGQEKFAKGLMIFNRTIINITLCRFLHNYVVNFSSNLILVSGGNINIIQTTMEHNLFLQSGAFHGAVLFWIDSSHTISIVKSILNGNFEVGFLKVTSNKLIQNSFLNIDNCSFHYNSIYVENIYQFCIDNSVFYTIFLDGIYTKSIKNVRIANTAFYSKWTLKKVEGNTYMLYFGRGKFILDNTNLYTFGSNFIGSNTSLLSNATDFLQKGISVGFIQTDWLFAPEQKETPYASSEFIFLNLCSCYLVFEQLQERQFFGKVVAGRK